METPVERPEGVGVPGAVAVKPAAVRLFPFLVFAVNLAAAAVVAQLIIAGIFPWTHHWIFAILAAWLLLQSLAFPRGGPVAGLVASSVLLFGVAVARLETITLSHHLIHFSIGFAVGALLHARMAVWPTSEPWRKANRSWAWSYLAIAVASALLAVRQGIWWNDGG